MMSLNNKELLRILLLLSTASTTTRMTSHAATTTSTTAMDTTPTALSRTAATLLDDSMWTKPKTSSSSSTLLSTLSSDQFHQQMALDRANPTFSQDYVTLLWEAFKVSFMVTRSEFGWISNVEEQFSRRYDTLKGFADFNDQALVAKTNDGVCYAAFMGTQAANPLDQIQNVNLFGPQIVGNTNCKVRGGFHDAYYTSYYDELRPEIDACVSSCSGSGGCPLVVTGHSQGGSIAVVAAIDLQEYEPLVMTFGALPVVMNETLNCNGIVAENHYRFVNVIDGVYDKYSMSLPLGAEHIGHLILLDDTNYPLAYPGMNSNFIRLPTNAQTHDRNIYFSRIQGLFDNHLFPIPLTGWPEGHICNFDDECNGSDICANGEVSSCALCSDAIIQVFICLELILTYVRTSLFQSPSVKWDIRVDLNATLVKKMGIVIRENVYGEAYEGFVLGNQVHQMVSH